MKVGYITKQDPNDIGAYSGTHYSMFQALKNEFEEVIPLGPIGHWYKNIAKLKGRIKTFGNNKVFKFQYDLTLARLHAKQLEKKIEKLKPDILFGSLVSPEVAFLETNIPIYLTTDATFPRLNELHKSHTNLHCESFENAMLLEKRAFQKARGLILPLEWLKKSAIQNYHIEEEKIKVVPYGSNILNLLSKNEIQNLVEERALASEVQFLFVGINWEQKGGPEAVAVIEELNRLGIDSTLKIVGCSPKLNSKNVEVIGFLDKQNPKELAQLIELYKKASFFILPTKAECVGMSFIEAASFGLPAIGTNVGGVPEAVLNKKTGFIFDVNESPKTLFDAIKAIWEDKSRYIEMSSEAHLYYSEKMNWENWAAKIRESVTG